MSSGQVCINAYTYGVDPVRERPILGATCHVLKQQLTPRKAKKGRRVDRKKEGKEKEGKKTKQRAKPSSRDVDITHLTSTTEGGSSGVAILIDPCQHGGTR